MKRGHSGIAFAMAMVVSTVLAGCGGNVPAPKNYTTWNATDGTFSVQYPEGWTASGGGKHGVQWAEFSKGSAKIRIDVSTQSSLIGDIAGSIGTAAGINDPFSGVSEEVAQEMAPVAAAHGFYQKSFPVDLSGYKEKEPVVYQCGLGDSRKSEFVARSGFTTRLRGYRATALTNNKGVHILCQCTDGNWKTLQPAFDTILESMKLGSPP
jgi:hypothetical protein